MMAVIELPDRPGKPLYHVEHYIGKVIEYFYYLLFLLISIMDPVLSLKCSFIKIFNFFIKYFMNITIFTL